MVKLDFSFQRYATSDSRRFTPVVYQIKFPLFALLWWGFEVVFQRKIKCSAKSAAGLGNSQFCPPVIYVSLRLSNRAQSFYLWRHTSLFLSTDNYSRCCPLFWPASDESFCPVTDNGPSFLSWSEAWPPWYFQWCVCVLWNTMQL